MVESEADSDLSSDGASEMDEKVEESSTAGNLCTILKNHKSSTKQEKIVAAVSCSDHLYFLRSCHFFIKLTLLQLFNVQEAHYTHHNKPYALSGRTFYGLEQGLWWSWHQLLAAPHTQPSSVNILKTLQMQRITRPRLSWISLVTDPPLEPCSP